MSNLTKFEFVALDITKKNDMSWILDTQIHFDAMNFRATIKEENQASLQDRAKALIFLRHHLLEDLKSEYLMVKEPLTLSCPNPHLGRRGETRQGTRTSLLKLLTLVGPFRNITECIII